MLRKFFSQNLHPFDITGVEETALCLMINFPYATEKQLLSEEVAAALLGSDDFWKAVNYSIAGWLTHNVKFLDSCNRGRVFFNGSDDGIRTYLGSTDITRGRRYGWSFNSSSMKTKKFLFSEFICLNQQLCLAEDLIKEGQFTQRLLDMGAPESQLEKTKDLLEIHSLTRFPEQAIEPQILIPDNNRSFLAITPVSSHLMQGEIHRRLIQPEYKSLRTILPIGNGPNTGTFGDLPSDSRGRIRILLARVKTRFPFWKLCLWRLARDQHLFSLSDTSLLLPEPRLFERKENVELDSYQNITDKEKALLVLSHEISDLFKDHLHLNNYLQRYPENKKKFEDQLAAITPQPITLKLLQEGSLKKQNYTIIANEAWGFWSANRLEKKLPFQVSDAYSCFIHTLFNDLITLHISENFS